MKKIFNFLKTKKEDKDEEQKPQDDD